MSASVTIMEWLFTMNFFPFPLCQWRLCGFRLVNFRFKLALVFFPQRTQRRLKGRRLLLAGFVSARVDFEPYKKSYNTRAQDQYEDCYGLHKDTSFR
jgi:hypothetical protein